MLREFYLNYMMSKRERFILCSISTDQFQVLPTGNILKQHRLEKFKSE